MVDLHSHIIWDIDDGSSSKEMTLEMLKTAVESGTKKIVATPHFYRGTWEATTEDVRRRLEDVRLLAKLNNIKIEIYQGQEVYYTENIVKYYSEGLISTINKSRYMLIELPMRDFKVSKVLDNIYELQLKGIVPIIAHPERYVPFIKNPTLINEFINEGFLFQLNTGSLDKHFGAEVKNLAEKFIEHKIYSFIGSDAHSVGRRNTNMKLGLSLNEKIDNAYMFILERNGQMVIDNGEAQFFGVEIEEKKKGLIGKFFG